jgi:hypothetical protein
LCNTLKDYREAFLEPPSTALGVLAREVREDDLIECLLIRPARLGDELVGRAQAIKAWQHLLRSRSLISAVFESPQPLAGRRILAFGADVFVSRTFAEAEIANQQPGLNGRIIASIDSGRPVVLSERELRAANTSGGLDSVILYGTWREDVLNPDVVSEVCASMASSFVKLHQGYRMNRLLTETVGVGERALYETVPGWRVISSFDDPNISRAFWTITREDALAIMGSILASLFFHREPVLQLRASDQRLMIAALDGLTDEELSLRLGLSLAGVKKRWISIFERTADVKPDLFPSCSNHDGRQRGRQKRHHLLAYLRSHPEELRPIEPHTGAQGALRRKQLR